MTSRVRSLLPAARAAVASLSCHKMARYASSLSELVTPAPFNSVRIDIPDNTEPAEIEAVLADSLDQWRQERKNAIWLRCPMSSGSVLSALQKHGFVFHHAGGQHAMLMKWLPTDIPCKVPPLATHQVGVAGVCADVSADGKVKLLVIKERNARSPQFKFPGGLADAGEHFGHTAVREVWEETGVRATFSCLLSFRHQHGLGFEGKVSDIYALCLVRPDRARYGDSACTISIDPHEIAEAAWVDGLEYIASCGHPLNRYVAALAIEQVQREERAQGRSLSVRAPSSQGSQRLSVPESCLGLEDGAAVAGQAMASRPIVTARELLGQPVVDASGSHIVEDVVYVPVTKKWVRAYRAAGGPAICNTPAELQAALAAGQGTPDLTKV